MAVILISVHSVIHFLTCCISLTPRYEVQRQFPLKENSMFLAKCYSYQTILVYYETSHTHMNSQFWHFWGYIRSMFSICYSFYTIYEYYAKYRPPKNFSPLRGIKFLSPAILGHTCCHCHAQ